MRRTMMILAVSAALLAAGCMQTQQDDGTTPTTTTGDAQINPMVTILEPTGDVQVAAGEEITVRWSVDPASGEHEIPHVGLHWGPDSVDADASTGPGAYGNNQGVQGDVMIPQEFTTTFSIDTEGTYYLRAHAIADGGTNYWSDTEIMIEVAAAMDGGSQGTTHSVQIGTSTSCSVANYDPSSITISVGDSMQWENVDSCPHTATPEGMSGTGNIDPGETSDPVLFDQAGTFAISCNYHPQMSGEVVVEA